MNKFWCFLLKKIAVIGTGYVGLVTGACLAELDNKVICVDIDREKIAMLNSGKMPIFEQGLEPLVKSNAAAGRISFTTGFDSAVKESEVIFICVGTPPLPNGDADLSYVENAVRRIAEIAGNQKIIVEKSTVPVQTGKRMQEILEKNSNRAKLEVVSNPEFLREGSAIEDFLHPDRIVIGTESEHARKVMEEIYRPLNAPMLFTDINSAEIIKHASNSFLAAKISFINAIADLCEKTNADIEMVAVGMGLDKRIGKHFLKAGIGYGGFCFPKDVEAFVRIFEKQGLEFGLLKEVQKLNERRKKSFIEKIQWAVGGINGKTIAVLGLAFKPNTDDMRFAPSIDIIKKLLEMGANVKAFDPVAMENAKKILNGPGYCSSAFEAAKNADALVIITEWKEFAEMDLGEIKKILKKPVIVDGRNIFDKQKMKELGFEYISVGR